MGLDVDLVVSIRSFRAGSYGGFNSFREAIAEATGTILGDMVGFGGQKEWSGEEPFYYLLDHSDCDGEIYDLEELLQDFKKHRETVFEFLGEDQYNKDKYDLWIGVLEEGGEKDGYLVFH